MCLLEVLRWVEDHGSTPAKRALPLAETPCSEPILAGLPPNGHCAFLVHLPQVPGEVNHLCTTGGAGKGLGVGLGFRVGLGLGYSLRGPLRTHSRPLLYIRPLP